MSILGQEGYIFFIIIIIIFFFFQSKDKLEDADMKTLISIRKSTCKQTVEPVKSVSTTYYCIKPTLPVRYKHVLTGGNWALTGENVY